MEQGIVAAFVVFARRGSQFPVLEVGGLQTVIEPAGDAGLEILQFGLALHLVPSFAEPGLGGFFILEKQCILSSLNECGHFDAKPC